MGLETAEISLQTQQSSECTPSSSSNLVLHDDVRAYLPHGNLEITVNPGDKFTLLIPFNPDHPMFENKPSRERQRELVDAVANGDLSIRSKIALSGVTHAGTPSNIQQLDDGTWVIEKEFANDGRGSVVVQTGIEIGRPFERPQHALQGAELLVATEKLSDPQHVCFVTRSGEIVTREQITTTVLADSSHDLYPVSVFLPYTEERGVLRDIFPPIDLQTVPNRLKGFERTRIAWENVQPSKVTEFEVMLRRTRGDIVIPDGFVGVIIPNGVEGQFPHSDSTAVGPRYVWSIIGEHTPRTAGSNTADPTGFAMNFYRIAE